MNKALLKSIVANIPRKADAPPLESKPSVNPIAARIVSAMECRGPKPSLTQERLKELLDYDPGNGIFRWKVDRGRQAKAGDEAGCHFCWPERYVTYVIIKIDSVPHAAHNLAWLDIHGVYPPDEGFELDHYPDRDGTNNRLSNLRPATPSQQMFNRRLPRNNSSGYRGVHWRQHLGKWQARIGPSGCISLGHFDNFEAAVNARMAAELKFYGELSDEGRN